MTSRIFHSLIICLATTLTFLPLAQAAPGKVTLTARSISLPGKKPAKPEKNKAVPDVDERKLEATLRNVGSEAMSGLQVNFYYLGHAVSSAEIKVLQKDTKQADVPAGGQLPLESKVFAASFTPAYSTKPKKDSDERSQRIKAEGEKFTGWAVQVISGTDVVAEAYSTPAMKTALGADGAVAPKP